MLPALARSTGIFQTVVRKTYKQCQGINHRATLAINANMGVSHKIPIEFLYSLLRHYLGFRKRLSLRTQTRGRYIINPLTPSPLCMGIWNKLYLWSTELVYGTSNRAWPNNLIRFPSFVHMDKLHYVSCITGQPGTLLGVSCKAYEHWYLKFRFYRSDIWVLY